MKKAILCIILLYISIFLSGYSPAAMPNPYEHLNIPSYITKVGKEYFIVDSYNNQVIFHTNLGAPLHSWSVMTSDVNQPHTIASDGVVYLIDDTENHRILVMERQVNGQGQTLFIPTQEFNEIGVRPHYIIYDEKSAIFYAWSSYTGEMFLFRREPDNTVVLSEVRAVPSLMGVYVRSFTIIGDEIYFLSCHGLILKANLKTFRIMKEYPVPEHMAGMIQMTKIEDYYYITVSTDLVGSQDFATIIRTNDFNSLADGIYEDIYSHFIGGGTPYNMTQIEGRWYLTEQRIPGRHIWSFSIADNMIEDVKWIY